MKLNFLCCFKPLFKKASVKPERTPQAKGEPLQESSSLVQVDSVQTSEINKAKNVRDLETIIDKLWKIDEDADYLLRPLTNQVLISPEMLMGVELSKAKPTAQRQSGSYYWRHPVRFPLHALGVVSSPTVNEIVQVLLQVPESEFKDHFSVRKDLEELKQEIRVVNRLGASRVFLSGLPIHLAAYAGNYRVVKLLIEKGSPLTGETVTISPSGMESVFTLQDCANASGDLETKELIESLAK